jgi:isoquinoline 1-oxidoreductase subunit beta
MSGIRVDRRSFLRSVAAVGGALVLGFDLGARPAGAAAGATETSADETGAVEICAWIVIERDDRVIIRVAKSEMGQGVLTALPMLVAEELQCDWRKVKPEFVSPSENLRRGRAWGNMSTGASRSVSASQQDLRRAGAIAREMLLAAAAAGWNMPRSECTVAHGMISHAASGRTTTFGAVAEAAAAMTPPKQVALKDPKDWTLIGTPQRRIDVPGKVVGAPLYGIDVRLPGMLYAAIVQCPAFKGTLKSVDESKLAGLKGIRAVLKYPDMVAVVADNWWRARKAADALTITWDNGTAVNVSSATIRETVIAGLGAAEARVARKDGNASDALAQAATRIEADYEVPFLAHATMEPQTCTAHVTEERVEVWAPTQDGETTLSIAAAAAGVPASKVVVHKMMLGGGFGRRGLVQDFVRQSVVIAKDVGQPVKLLWTREEDIRHDQYRPVGAARMTAGFDPHGMPTALKIRLSGPSIMAGIAPHIVRFGLDRNFVQGLLEEMTYQVPNYLLDYAVCETPVPLGMWRGVNHSQNAFFKECFIDEMAQAVRSDPYLFRRKLLAKQPRELAVLDAAADRANWSRAPHPDVFRGIALHGAQDSICAQVVEVSVTDDGRPRVHRVVSAIDAGHVVNPLTVEEQTEGAIVYGLTAALYGEITIKDGQVEQSNFNDYRMLRMAEMPRIETVIVPSAGTWGGVGEPPLPPIAPALCNAIFAATGRRVRSLPIKNVDLRKA